MRSQLTRFAVACVAALALATPASAATILQFAQQFTTDGVNAAVTNPIPPGNTMLTTFGPVSSPTSVPIVITQLGTLVLPPGMGILAFETFFPFLGAVPGAITSTLPIAGGIQNGFFGTIKITTAAGGGGSLFLQADIQNGRLSANGGSGDLQAASFTTNGGAPTTVTLTSANANVIAAMGAPTTLGALSLSLNDITPQQSGGGFVNFKATNQGGFSTVAIPEPAGFISASIAIVAGLGGFGWSRRKSSKA